MARMTQFNSPFLLGFDQIEQLLDRVAKSSDGYPPYNVEQLPATHADGREADGKADNTGRNEDILRITLAVAGFSRDELSVTVEDNQLVIQGRQREEGDRTYLHRGIAARQFQRKFVLAEGVEVAGARLENGLLIIDLLRPEPARTVRRIDIVEGEGGKKENSSMSSPEGRPGRLKEDAV